MNKERDKFIVEISIGMGIPISTCWHDFKPTYRWGLRPDEWSFDKEYAQSQRVTIPKRVMFKGSEYCTQCKRSIIQTGKNPDFDTWPGFGLVMDFINKWPKQMIMACMRDHMVDEKDKENIKLISWSLKMFEINPKVLADKVYQFLKLITKDPKQFRKEIKNAPNKS